MAHLPLHGIQTKAQRLSTLAHEVSLAGGHSAWIYRLTETPAPVAARLRTSVALPVTPRTSAPLARTGQEN
jgi:hypothetical protein